MKQVTVEYTAAGQCPAFLAALNFWTNGDLELQRTIQQLLGLSITGVTREQIFIILHGPASTGKSTLIEIVNAIFGNYATALASDTFLLRKHSAPEERKVAALVGARFASASETEAGGVLAENLIKMLTGEDKTAARFLYREKEDYMPEAKIWLRTNNLPDIRGIDGAIWRRVIIVPFGNIVPEKAKDVQLKDKLHRELSGILKWMVDGYLDYAKHGFYKAPVILKAIAAYRKEQDVLERFFEEKCEFGPTFTVGKAIVHSSFSDWCETNHLRGMRSQLFHDQLVTRFADRIKEDRAQTEKRERVWLGVRTKMSVFEAKPVAAKVFEVPKAPSTTTTRKLPTPAPLPKEKF